MILTAKIQTELGIKDAHFQTSTAPVGMLIRARARAWEMYFDIKKGRKGNKSLASEMALEIENELIARGIPKEEWSMGLYGLPGYMKYVCAFSVIQGEKAA